MHLIHLNCECMYVCVCVCMYMSTCMRKEIGAAVNQIHQLPGKLLMDDKGAAKIILYKINDEQLQ